MITDQGANYKITTFSHQTCYWGLAYCLSNCNHDFKVVIFVTMVTRERRTSNNIEQFVNYTLYIYLLQLRSLVAKGLISNSRRRHYRVAEHAEITDKLSVDVTPYRVNKPNKSGQQFKQNMSSRGIFSFMKCSMECSPLVYIYT